MSKQPFTEQYSNPLKRGGLSRPERDDTADLRPASAAVDGRGVNDLLHFWQEYARQINYFDQSATAQEGDWLPFFRRSIPFQYASIAAHDLEQIDERFTALKASIDSRLTFGSLHGLFDLLFEMADRLAQWQSNLRDDTAGLRTVLDGLVETNLRSWTIRLIGLANAAGKWAYRPALSLDTIQSQFGIGVTQSFAVDQTILRLRGSLKHRVLAARDLLEEVYRVLWKATEAVVATARDADVLERTLRSEAAAGNPAHLGLMFSFLLLFKELQGSLNGLSSAHLDFFYRQTLRLDELPARDDRAHLVFSLGKQVQEAVKVEKGTRFKAGKDANGAEVFFELPADHVVTQTQVGEFKSLYIDQGPTGSLPPDRLYGVHAAPVANSADGVGGAFPKGETESWPTVGAAAHRAIDPETGEPADDVPYPDARLGWLIAGKVLLLREGERKIELSITLEGDSLADYDYPAAGVALFRLYLSTDEGWTAVPTSPVWTLAGNELQATLTLPPDFLPVVYPAEAEKLGLAQYGTSAPMLKAELDHAVVGQKDKVITQVADGVTTLQTVSEAVSWYYALRTQAFNNIAVTVTVCDLRQIIVQNDFAVLDPNKPFMPFGPLPKADSSNFYLGSEELYCKNWDQVDVTLRWKDKPNFSTHYQGYPTIPTDAAYVAQVAVLGNKQFTPVAGVTKPLFGNDPAATGLLCGAETGAGIYQFSLEAAEFPNRVIGRPGLDLSGGYTQDLPNGFFRLKLGGQDFLHDRYAEALLSAAMEVPNLTEFKDDINSLQGQVDTAETYLNSINNSSFDTGSVVYKRVWNSYITIAETASNQAKTLMDSIQTDINGVIVPAAPYTPLLESIRFDYRASANYGDGDVALLHLHPWEGSYETVRNLRIAGPAGEPQRASLLPCFLDEGGLYLGLDHYRPGELLQLYFNLDPASADPTVDKATVCWEYLRGNAWYPLRADVEVLADTTQGLIRPGIVTLAVPTKISPVGTTILPNGRYWIKARVGLRTAAICETLLIATQAAEVVYAPAVDNDPARLAAPLAAGGIAKLAAPVNGVQGVTQPAATFGGREPEAPQAYYGRISEHLRHKDRAIAISDYERLVLNEFPQIYRVKCLNHTLGRRGQDRDYEMCPGFVTLVVVPDLVRLPAPDVYQPRVPAADLQAIKDFLAERTTPFLRLAVLNPIYEPVTVSATVRFRKGKSSVFYSEQLQRDLRTFLAPWSGANPGADISFGGALYYSSVLHFVEELSYVEYVLELSLLNDRGEASEKVTARYARSVLTTQDTHLLTLDESDAATADATGTGIGYDFKILT